jgi:TRAP-type mannitol/chloroaromatic compound transport system permease small subunit
MNSFAVREGSPDPGGLPRYPIKAAIPLGFIFLLLQGLSLLIRRIAFLVEPDVVPADESLTVEHHAGGHV